MLRRAGKEERWLKEGWEWNSRAVFLLRFIRSGEVSCQADIFQFIQHGIDTGCIIGLALQLMELKAYLKFPPAYRIGGAAAFAAKPAAPRLQAQEVRARGQACCITLFVQIKAIEIYFTGLL